MRIGKGFFGGDCCSFACCSSEASWEGEGGGRWEDECEEERKRKGRAGRGNSWVILHALERREKKRKKNERKENEK